MNEHEQQNWPAQEPSVEFASRTAQTILDLQRAAPQVRRIRWGKPVLLLLAAALLSAGAWGAISASKYFAPRETPQTTVNPGVQQSPRPVEHRAVASPPETIVSPAALPSASVKKNTPRTTVEPPPAASASPVPSGLPKPRTPPCWCDPGAVICGCVE